jgi:sialidase-1
LLLTWNAGHISEANIQPGFGENSRRVAVMSSNDNGKTWNQHRWITADVKQPDWSWYATGPGAGIELQHGPHAGRLIIPCDHKVISDNQIKFRSHIIYSDDQGRSWHLGGIAPDVQVNECEAVELSDGSILLNMRNYDKADRTRQVATSRDGGLSFVDQHHDRALIDPVCQASIRRVAAGSDQMPKGVILFSNPAHPDKREQLTIRASDNDTLSWPYSRSLYEGSAAYSCLALLPDGKIGCLYERDNYSKILLASFPLSWIVNDDSLESIK